jgi:hypothetical protein
LASLPQSGANVSPDLSAVKASESFHARLAILGELR